MGREVGCGRLLTSGGRGMDATETSETLREANQLT